MILKHIQRPSLVVRFKKGITHFLFPTTVTIYCSENPVNTFNLHPAYKSHSSLPSQLKKNPEPQNTFFFMHTSIVLRSLLYVYENKLDTGFLLPVVSRGPVYLVDSQE